MWTWLFRTQMIEVWTIPYTINCEEKCGLFRTQYRCGLFYTQQAAKRDVDYSVHNKQRREVWTDSYTTSSEDRFGLFYIQQAVKRGVDYSVHNRGVEWSVHNKQWREVLDWSVHSRDVDYSVHKNSEERCGLIRTQQAVKRGVDYASDKQWREMWTIPYTIEVWTDPYKASSEERCGPINSYTTSSEERCELINLYTTRSEERCGLIRTQQAVKRGVD